MDANPITHDTPTTFSPSTNFGYGNIEQFSRAG